MDKSIFNKKDKNLQFTFDGISPNDVVIPHRYIIYIHVIKRPWSARTINTKSASGCKQTSLIITNYLIDAFSEKKRKKMCRHISCNRWICACGVIVVSLSVILTIVQPQKLIIRKSIHQVVIIIKSLSVKNVCYFEKMLIIESCSGQWHLWVWNMVRLDCWISSLHLQLDESRWVYQRGCSNSRGAWSLRLQVNNNNKN